MIEGFPGFGLVGTIATEFLVEHLKTELIGKFWFEELPAMVAIHKEKLVEPVGIFYNKKYNLVIMHAIAGSQGLEWKMADSVLDVAKQLNAKKLISLEGVGSNVANDKPRIFFHTNKESDHKKLVGLKVEPLKEGIIMGVTSAIMLKSEIPTTALFAETHSELPDSKAAARIIETLDKYIGLDVDYKPLFDMAEKFEEKIKGIMQQGKSAQEMRDKKMLSYVG